MLKKIDLQAGHFMANGKKYIIENGLSVGRYIMFEQIEIELGFGRNFAEIYDEMRASLIDINNHKQGEAYKKIDNVANAMSDFAKKKPSVFRYCALFMNTETESRAEITEAQINQKVNDWQLEGLDYEDFFTFAIGSLRGFKERYKKLMESISQ